MSWTDSEEVDLRGEGVLAATDGETALDVAVETVNWVSDCLGGLTSDRSAQRSKQSIPSSKALKPSGRPIKVKGAFASLLCRGRQF